MRLLFLGDVVGRSGRRAVVDRLPTLIASLGADFTVVNGENAAGGFGITGDITRELLDAGADAVTLGNHAFDQREVLVHIEREPRLIRPANYPEGTPGRGGNLLIATNGMRVLVINMMGRLFMDPLDDPFARIDRELAACPLGEMADVVFVDFHAEATSEKQSFANHVDGRVTAVLCTHTHVPTADHRVLPQGTAYQSDVGMCGDYQSIIGMDTEEPVQRFVRKIGSGRPQPAMGEATVCGALIDIDDTSGLALSIKPIRLGGCLSEAHPAVS